MEFTETIEMINNFLKSPIIFDQDQINLIKNNLGLMTDDINCLLNDKELEQNNEKIVSIINCTLMISGILLDCPLSDKFTKFIKSYTELVFNWNQNVAKDEVLRQLPLYMSRLVEMRDISLESISTMKSLETRMMDLASWAPPSYDVAKDYLEKLLEENEK